ncbi:MAG: hypothetical protein FJ138_13500, partial [Deltaproteobacteria bacterium]|nr:hypothetical protein [Deltaproteobacteria bacterium]
AAESEAPLAPLAAAAPGDLEVALEWAHVHRARARPLQADALLLSVGERALAAGRRPLAREAYEALRAARPDDPAARRALAALESAPPTPAAPPAPAPPWAPEADEGAEADEDAEARDLLRDARAHLTAGRAEHAFELLRRLLAGPHLRAEGLALLIEVATALGEPLLARSAAEAREELLGARGALGGEVVGGAVGLAAALEVMPEGAPEAAPEAALEVMPEGAPEAAPEAALEVMPEGAPEAAPEAALEAALEVMPEGAPEAAPAAPLFLPLNTPIELRLARLISAETRELLRAPEAPPSAPPAPPPAPRLAPSAPPPRLHAEAEELEWPLSARARARRALGEGGGRGLSGAPFTPAPLLPPAGARPPLAEEQPARPPAPAPPQSPPAPPEGLSAPPASPPAPPASPPARPERAPEGAHAGPLLDALLGRLARFAREGDAGGAGVGLDGDLQDLELLLISEGHEGADAAPALLDASFSLSLDEALARGEGLLEALDFSEALSLSIALDARLTPPPGGAARAVAARGGGARPHRAGGLPLPPLDARLRLLGGGGLPPSLDAALALYLAGELELARAALGALGAGRAQSYLGALCALELGGLREGVEGIEAALVLALGAPAEARALLYALAADLYDALGRDDECERCLMELLALSPELGAALYALLRAV